MVPRTRDLDLDAVGALDALEEGVVLLDGGRVRYLNQAAARLLQVERERAVGRPAIAVLRDHRLELVAVGGAATEVERAGRRLAAVPVQGGVLLRDMTQLRRAQEDARELLAVLSHELRTPVTAIRAALEALATEPPDRIRRRFLERAGAEAERLVRLLEDLTVDVRPPRERSVDLHALAARAAAVVQPLAARHGVRVELEVPDEDLWVDEDKLLQVLINLLENAVVHGPDDASVRLVGWTEGGAWRLEVRDQGAPLDPAGVDALFQPHSRGRSAKAKGTGLGLYIVRSIAERWGGRAWGGPRGDGGGNAFGVSVPGRRT